MQDKVVYMYCFLLATYGNYDDSPGRTEELDTVMEASFSCIFSCLGLSCIKLLDSFPGRQELYPLFVLGSTFFLESWRFVYDILRWCYRRSANDAHC